MLFQRDQHLMLQDVWMRVERYPRLEALVGTKSSKGEQFRFYSEGNQQSSIFESGLGQGQIFVLQRSNWDREENRLRESEAKLRLEDYRNDPGQRSWDINSALAVCYKGGMDPQEMSCTPTDQLGSVQQLLSPEVKNPKLSLKETLRRVGNFVFSFAVEPIHLLTCPAAWNWKKLNPHGEEHGYFLLLSHSQARGSVESI